MRARRLESKRVREQKRKRPLEESPIGSECLRKEQEWERVREQESHREKE